MADGARLRVSPLLVQQIKILVSKYKVLSETSFRSYFAKLFHKELDHAEAGHPSLNSLLSSMASAGVIDLSYENFSLTIRASRETLLETRQVTETCDLSELDTLASSSVVDDMPPEDTVLNYVLPVEELPPRYKEGETFPVVITQVDSPSKFWFNLQQSGYLDRVNNIMDMMNEFYRGVRGDMYRMSRADHLKPGNILAAEYEGKGFHRAVVIKVMNSSVVKLFYLDYGTVDTQKVKHCRYLHVRFSKLPGQAIQARLWGVRPVGGGRRWDKGHKARNMLVELADTLEGGLIATIRAGVTKKEVTVRGVDELEEERSLALSLMDVFEGDDGQDIASELVMKGLAEWELMDVKEEDSSSVCKVKYSPGEYKDSWRGEKRPMVDHQMNEYEEPIACDQSPYLKLLILHEENMKKLCKAMEGHDLGRRKCMEEISKKRQERQELEMVWAIDRELEK